MKKVVMLIAIVAFSITKVEAQEYNWAIGTRIGTSMSGISLKYHLDALNAIEAVVAIPYKNGFNLTGLYERHLPVIDDHFNFYYGAGAHLGAFDKKFLLGIDGIVGLEYKVPTIPLALSLDYKPQFDIVSEAKFRWDNFGLGIKVTF